MARHDLSLTIALLTRTPSTIDALLRGLPTEWTDGDEGPGTWSAADIVSHLAHADRTNWIPRIRAILRSEGIAPLDAFDRHAFETGAPLDDRLEDFRQVRAASLAELQELHLRPGDLARQGRHPAAGVVTLAQLLATWAVHDLTHLHQITRVLAHQYRDDVGPWGAYLGVLHCTGHGAQS